MKQVNVKRSSALNSDAVLKNNTKTTEEKVVRKNIVRTNMKATEKVVLKIARNITSEQYAVIMKKIESTIRKSYVNNKILLYSTEIKNIIDDVITDELAEETSVHNRIVDIIFGYIFPYVERMLLV